MKSGNNADRKKLASKTPIKSDLASQYGAVGILAVAAALRYQNEEKKSAEAQIDTGLYDRFMNAQA